MSVCGRGSNQFRCSSDLPGAQILSRLYALEHQGQLGTKSVNGIVNNIIAFGYTVATTRCQQAYVAQQTIDFSCVGKEAGESVANNPNCAYCQKVIKDLVAGRVELEKEAARKNTNYKPQKANEALENAVTTDLTENICQYMCQQCVMRNVEQDLQMRIVDSCEINTENFMDAFEAGMTSAAKAALASNSKSMAKAGINIQNQDNLNSFSEQISNTLRSMTTINLLNSLKSDALVAQNITVDPNSTSVVLQNIKQSINVSMMASLTSRYYTDASIQDSIDYQNVASSLNQLTNFEDVFAKFTASISTFSSLLSDTLTRILMLLALFAALGLLIFATILFLKPPFIFEVASDLKLPSETQTKQTAIPQK